MSNVKRIWAPLAVACLVSILFSWACSDGNRVPSIECDETIKAYISEIAFEKMHEKNKLDHIFLFTAKQDIKGGMDHEIRARFYDDGDVACGSGLFWIVSEVSAGEKGRANITVFANHLDKKVAKIKLVHEPWKTKKE